MSLLLGTEQGTYRVVTQNTDYTIDLDAKTVTRGRVDMQFADGHRVFDLVQVVLAMTGWGMQLRVSVNGEERTISTSEVHAIAKIATPVPAPWIRNSDAPGKSHLPSPREVPIVGVSNLAACGSMVHKVEVVPAVRPAAEDRCKRCVAVSTTTGYLAAAGAL
jgi:hypothetical protein